MTLKKWIQIAAPALLLASSLVAAGKIDLTNVPAANVKIPGVTLPTVLSPELIQVVAAQGSMRVENRSILTSYYGYDNDLLSAPGVPRMLPAPGSLPSAGKPIQAAKTGTDNNKYLILNQQDGQDANYKYGRHFLFQGHELGAGGQGYITRVNLDADAQHRITLLATTDVNGKSLPVFDGSTFLDFEIHINPFVAASWLRNPERSRFLGHVGFGSSTGRKNGGSYGRRRKGCQEQP